MNGLLCLPLYRKNASWVNGYLITLIKPKSGSRCYAEIIVNAVSILKVLVSILKFRNVSTSRALTVGIGAKMARS